MLSLQVLQTEKQDAEKTKTEPMRNATLTTDIRERDKQGLMQRTCIISMCVFLELWT